MDFIVLIKDLLDTKLGVVNRFLTLSFRRVMLFEGLHFLKAVTLSYIINVTKCYC